MLNDLNPEKLIRVYIVCGYTDLRYGIDGLTNVVRSEFKMNPFEKKYCFSFLWQKV